MRKWLVLVKCYERSKLTQSQLPLPPLCPGGLGRGPPNKPHSSLRHRAEHSGLVITCTWAQWCLAVVHIHLSCLYLSHLSRGPCSKALESFYHKMMLNFFQMLFLHLLRWVFLLYFVSVRYHVDWFADGEPSWRPWCASDLVVVNYPLMCCWIWFANVLLWIYEPIHCPVVFFFCNVFIWFWYQGNANFIKWFWKQCFLLIFGNSLRRIGINSSSNVW